MIKEERHEWPGASQLLLKFDRRCCTEDGDWLTLQFLKRNQVIRTVRIGGQWTNWPKQLTVPADTLHVVFKHTSESQHDETWSHSWGYDFSVVASKRWVADKLRTPSLDQLRTSLVYLGAKCACLLCSGEPVEKEEKENRHWLNSPLLSRGLPLNLAAGHPLMHEFFGINGPQGDAAHALEAEAQFLNDLAQLKMGTRASRLYHYLFSTTPELQQRDVPPAARTLLASLLSYHGLVGVASKAAAVLESNTDLVDAFLLSSPPHALQARADSRSNVVPGALSPPPSPPPSPPSGTEPLPMEPPAPDTLEDAGSPSSKPPHQRWSSLDGRPSSTTSSMRDEFAALQASMEAGSSGQIVHTRPQAHSTVTDQAGTVDATDVTDAVPPVHGEGGACAAPNERGELSVIGERSRESRGEFPEQSERGAHNPQSTQEAVYVGDGSGIVEGDDGSSSVDAAPSAPGSSPVLTGRDGDVSEHEGPKPLFGDGFVSGVAAVAKTMRNAALGSRQSSIASDTTADEATERRQSRGSRSSPSTGSQHGGVWEEGKGAAAGIEWSTLRAQCLSALKVYRDMDDAYRRTLTNEERLHDRGEGLHKLTRFILKVAQQHVASPADLTESGAAEQLGIRDPIRRLFRAQSTDASRRSARTVEQDLVDLVAARVRIEGLRNLIFLQQRRAYSRAAGYHAAHQLLAACEGNPRLQCKLLSELVATLQPTGDHSTNEIAAHYSRDLQCAGPRAFQRLQFTFSQLLEQLVRLLRVGPSSAERQATEIQQAWAMRCLLYIELRDETDLAMQQEIKMFETVHDIVSALHGRRVLNEMSGQLSGVSEGLSGVSEGGQSERHSTRWQTDRRDVFVDSKRMPQTVQLFEQVIISRLFHAGSLREAVGVPLTGRQGAGTSGGTTLEKWGNAGSSSGLGKPAYSRNQSSSSSLDDALTGRSASGSAKNLFGAQVQSGGGSIRPPKALSRGQNAGIGSGDVECCATVGLDEAETDILERQLKNIDEVAENLREFLSDDSATAIGAETAHSEWATAERYLHGSLALLFHLAVGRPHVVNVLSHDNGLRTLFSALQVSSLRCARLVLRMLRHVLPHRTLASLPASLFSLPWGDLELDDAGEPLAGNSSAAQAGLVSQALPSTMSPLIVLLFRIVADQSIDNGVDATNLALLSTRSLWRGSHVRCALAAEAVVLLRELMLSAGFQSEVRTALCNALHGLPGVVASLKQDPSAEDHALLWAAKLGLGALSVLGGSLPSLFVGGRVIVEAEVTSKALQDLAQPQEGVLVRWDGADDSVAHVLLDSQLGELQLMSVSALQLLPLDSAALPLGTFILSADLVPCFECFLPKGNDRSQPKAKLPGELRRSFVFGLLQSRALKALMGLLKQPDSMRVVLDGGLLRGIMASASTPMPLVGSYQTEVLQMRITHLEQIHVEASTAARMAKAHVARSRRSTRGSHASSVRQPDASSTTVSASDVGRNAEIDSRVEALEQMGFESTLCQKAVGKFGNDTDAAVVWLTDEGQQHAQRLNRSNSWGLAEDLAQVLGEFSVSACKKALTKTGNDKNLAAEWLFTNGSAVEEELEDESRPEAPPQVTEFLPERPSVHASEEDDVADEETLGLRIRTISFRPQAGNMLHRADSLRAPAQISRRTDSDFATAEVGGDAELEVQEFISAAPAPPPPLPDESRLDTVSREGATPLLMSRQHVGSAASKLKDLEPEECLVGKLLRPVPLPHNKNHVVTYLNEAERFVQLSARNPETDAMVRYARALSHCQQAEASLAAMFPELRNLGANSSGLNAVSGSAHTALSIILMREAVIYLLADMAGLQRSHEDESSAFDISHLGRAHELLDLLKLACHSMSFRSITGDDSPFAKLWGLLEELMQADQEEKQLLAPFKKLPLLLREDALDHLNREVCCPPTATKSSDHPIATGKLNGKFQLRLEGAAQITLHLDARSKLGGTAQLVFSEDELGHRAVARWSGDAAGWDNVSVLGDSLWVHLSGEIPKKELNKKPWGFSVRITASRWVPPDNEEEALKRPLTIGWQLMELLSQHRPTQLLTKQIFLAIARYVNTVDAPHRALAASILLGLLNLPKSVLPNPDNDPRDAWSMELLMGLALHVEWHINHGIDYVSGLLPPHVQLCAELVALAHLRSTPTGAHPTMHWITSINELRMAARFFLHGDAAMGEDTPRHERPELPRRWHLKLEHYGQDLSAIFEHTWTVPMLATLVMRVANAAKGAKMTTKGFPLTRLNEFCKGQLAGMSSEAMQSMFVLLILFNEVLEGHLSLVFTGYADNMQTLGAQLCMLRELIFPEVKQAAWTKALDNTAQVQDTAWIKENPPMAVTINRHRAAKERADRRERMRHTVFSQLYSQLQFADVNQLKRRDRAFKVRFAGEAADDHGGPYREVFTSICSDLQNAAAMPLLLLSPNGQHGLGTNRDRYIVDPSATTPELLKCFEFIGQLAAIALLETETVLSLNVCSVFWKQLVQQQPDASDLAAFDDAVCQSLKKIEHIEEEGIDEELFADLIFESFTAQLSNGVEVEVCTGGSNMDVTWHNRKNYCDLVMRARLKEGRAQAHAALRGISSILPVRLLPLFTHGEFELMVCGIDVIDIENLKRHTRYGVSVDTSEPHITLLWQVLEAFTPEQRSKFLTFIWGRNRLPQTEEEWGDQCMKIHTLESQPADGYFPVSHTCFFSMEWPRYTSFEVAREKLLYAVVVCQTTAFPARTQSACIRHNSFWSLLTRVNAFDFLCPAELH